MRIITGSLRGLTFDSPTGHRTHPMSEKVRGALFNLLGDVRGLTFLDAFAGSGALSFEAISRGAKQAVAIDIDKKAYETMAKNVQKLGIRDQVKIIRANASSWSDNNPEVRFDIVIAAPPYDDLQLQVVTKLIKHIKPGGLFVLDWPGKQPAPAIGGLEIIANKNYGDAQLIFYK